MSSVVDRKLDFNKAKCFYENHCNDRIISKIKSKKSISYKISCLIIFCLINFYFIFHDVINRRNYSKKNT